MNVDDILGHADGPGHIPHVVAAVDQPLSKDTGSNRRKAAEPVLQMPRDVVLSISLTDSSNCWMMCWFWKRTGGPCAPR